MYVSVKINLISITVANVEEEHGEVGHLFSKVYQLTVINFLVKLPNGTKS